MSLFVEKILPHLMHFAFLSNPLSFDLGMENDFSGFGKAIAFFGQTGSHAEHSETQFCGRPTTTLLLNTMKTSLGQNFMHLATNSF